MNRTVRSFLLSIPILAAMLLCNWWIDPDHVRAPDAYERHVAELLSQGNAVTNVVNDDASGILEYSILGQTAAPDVLLLGTSKSKGLNSRAFPGKTYFNAALSGSHMADLLVIYNMYESRGMLPKELVFEVNPWLLTAGRKAQVPRFEAQRVAVEAALLQGAADSGERPTRPTKARSQARAYSRMFTPDYFQLALTNLLGQIVNGTGGGVRVYQAGDAVSGTTYFPDGSILVPPYMTANLGTLRPEAEALRYAWDPPGGIPLQMDPRQQRILEAFVQHLQDKGVKVTFYLPPYHPTSYRLMLDSPNRVVVDIQAYFIALAQKHGFDVIGSYDPAEAGVTEADFYDLTHITPDAILRIFSGKR